jgi:hypothetical protein
MAAARASAYPMRAVSCRSSAVLAAVNSILGRLHPVGPAPRPGGQRGIRLFDVHAGHRPARGAQQARGDTSVGSG